MRSEDYPEFTTLIAALSATFHREATEALYTGYWLGLRGLALSELRLAVAKAINDLKFMPVPAELRELAGTLAPQDRAVKAWDVVVGTLRSRGGGHTVQFDDPVANATVANLWHNWIGFEEAWFADDEKWLRKEFERVYCSLLRSGVPASGYKPLAGEYEIENAKAPDRIAMAVARGWQEPSVYQIACGLPSLPQLGYVPVGQKRIGRAPVALLENVGKMPDTVES